MPAFQFTEREAYLMRYYIENVALFADVADTERHFEIEAPRRALEQPALRTAIFALSSRTVNSINKRDETEALQYYNQCLQLLIPILAGPSENITEDILATIATLRQYEEMDAYDNRCHLIGTTSILNSISTFGSSGGLGEAAAWLCLREEIHVSLVLQQPLRTNLANYHNSATSQRKHDVSWANRMVYLLAKILSRPVEPQTNSTGANSSANAPLIPSHEQLDAEIEAWNATKPTSFNPILHKLRGSVAHGAYRNLPKMWMLAPFHAVGLQYYHIAKIVLAVSAHSTLSGYEAARQGRKLERTVRNHLQVILGLAVSNKAAANTMFTARHTLAVWGGMFRDQADQEAAIAFLADFEKMTGWKTSDLATWLRLQWDEEGSDGG